MTVNRPWWRRSALTLGQLAYLGHVARFPSAHCLPMVSVGTSPFASAESALDRAIAVAARHETFSLQLGALMHPLHEVAESEQPTLTRREPAIATRVVKSRDEPCRTASEWVVRDAIVDSACPSGIHLVSWPHTWGIAFELGPRRWLSAVASTHFAMDGVAALIAAKDLSAETATADLAAPVVSVGDVWASEQTNLFIEKMTSDTIRACRMFDRAEPVSLANGLSEPDTAEGIQIDTTSATLGASIARAAVSCGVSIASCFMALTTLLLTQSTTTALVRSTFSRRLGRLRTRYVGAQNYDAVCLVQLRPDLQVGEYIRMAGRAVMDSYRYTNYNPVDLELHMIACAQRLGVTDLDRMPTFDFVSGRQGYVTVSSGESERKPVVVPEFLRGPRVTAFVSSTSWGFSLRASVRNPAVQDRRDIFGELGRLVDDVIREPQAALGAVVSNARSAGPLEHSSVGIVKSKAISNEGDM